MNLKSCMMLLSECSNWRNYGTKPWGAGFFIKSVHVLTTQCQASQNLDVDSKIPVPRRPRCRIWMPELPWVYKVHLKAIECLNPNWIDSVFEIMFPVNCFVAKKWSGNWNHLNIIMSRAKRSVVALKKWNETCWNAPTSSSTCHSAHCSQHLDKGVFWICSYPVKSK